MEGREDGARRRAAGFWHGRDSTLFLAGAAVSARRWSRDDASAPPSERKAQQQTTVNLPGGGVEVVGSWSRNRESARSSAPAKNFSLECRTLRVAVVARRLDGAALFEAVVAAVADDDVIEQRNVEDFAGRSESTGDCEIIRRWRRIA